jgi:protein arginine kinase activator
MQNPGQIQAIGMQQGSGFSAQGFMPQLIAIVPMIQGAMLHSSLSGAMSNYSCNSCKSSFEEFLMHGKFSCPDCYEAFASELRKQLKHAHGASRYQGKYPVRAYKHLRVIKTIQQLKVKLDEELKKENYESAVEIRDTIKNLEQEIENSFKTTPMD